MKPGMQGEHTCIAKRGTSTPSKPHTPGSALELSPGHNNSAVLPDFPIFKGNLEIDICKCLEFFFKGTHAR